MEEQQQQDRPRVRDAFVGLVRERLGLDEDAARDLEVGVFNAALASAEERNVAKTWRNPRFEVLYMAKLRKVFSNLDPASYVGNSRLLSRLREGEFRPHKLASMRPENVFPERWQSVLDLRQQRDQYMATARHATVTDQFRCGRCKKRECEYQEAQLRSCDEPATLFITCLNCGHRWRLG